MTTLFNFQFPESHHKIVFCWDADIRPKSEIHPISDFIFFLISSPIRFSLTVVFFVFFNKNLNASKPSNQS